MIDWDKTIHSVSEVARKTGVLAISLVVVMTSFAAVYIAALTLLWLVQQARIALGS